MTKEKPTVIFGVFRYRTDTTKEHDELIDLWYSRERRKSKSSS